MEVKIQEYDATIHVKVADSIALTGDEILLTNAMAALIDNAIKYNSNKPEIVIAVLQTKKYVTIAVQDNGNGIKKQFRKKVFEPFFRITDGNIYDIPGHGLGLSFVKQVAKLHKGMVSFASNERGTIFYLKFPNN